jgi:hypothetical protein
MMKAAGVPDEVFARSGRILRIPANKCLGVAQEAGKAAA